MISTGEKYALVLWNIKNFRYYNIKYGVRAGDEILELVLQTMQRFLKEREYVGYSGTDNFVMLLRYENIDMLIHHILIPFVQGDLYRIDDVRISRNIFYSSGIYQVGDDAVDFQMAMSFANLSRKESSSLYNRCTNIELYDQTFHDKYMERMELEIKTSDA